MTSLRKTFFSITAAATMLKTSIKAATIVAALVFFAMAPAPAFAWDTSGPHAFFNDDKHQFIDVWYNDNGHVTFKVSNGRPWRPMWVVGHVTFLQGGQPIATRDYHVYCPSPNAGGGGAERWFEFGDPLVGAADGLSATTNKESPWKSVPGDQPVMISVSGDAP